jgi:hypothetical protein
VREQARKTRKTSAWQRPRHFGLNKSRRQQVANLSARRATTEYFEAFSPLREAQLKTVENYIAACRTNRIFSLKYCAALNRTQKIVNGFDEGYILNGDNKSLH